MTLDAPEWDLSPCPIIQAYESDKPLGDTLCCVAEQKDTRSCVSLHLMVFVLYNMTGTQYVYMETVH